MIIKISYAIQKIKVYTASIVADIQCKCAIYIKYTLY